MLVRLLCLLVCICTFNACSEKEKKESFTIGFSQCTDDSWRKAMVEGMKRELSFHPEMKFILKQAKASSARQGEQIKELINEGIDLLIVSPNEVEPLTTLVEDVYTKGIPVIVLDRKINSKLYSAFIGSDNFEIGRQAGNYAVKILGTSGKILEITGLPTSSPAIERHNGFNYSIKNYPGLQVVQSLNGLWDKQEAQKQLKKELTRNEQYDLIYAHNDEMGLAAYELYQSMHLAAPKIIGVDGLPGKNGGMEFVSDRILTATMLYLTGGEESIRTASKILNHEEYKRDTYLQTSVVDSTNVRMFQLQAEKLSDQQNQIERQQDKVSNLLRIYNNQRTFLYILLTTLTLAIVFGGIAFFSLRGYRKVIKKLNIQNTEILNNRNQLIEMSVKAKEASEAKVNFFTVISHEFRTPLTLIMSPLEDMIANPKAVTREGLRLVYKNAARLLTVVNQLIDFRKTEIDKMKLSVAEHDIVSFLSETIKSFESIATKKNIDIRLVTRERMLNVWFDADLFGKAIFNLLSNAFKFTADNGYINIFLEKEPVENKVLLKIEDNGIGMTPEDQEHIFDLFYQAHNSHQPSSSGIGLALSLKFIQLHKGNISVKSEKWKGSVFTIELPLGNTHFESAQIAADELPVINNKNSAFYLPEHESSFEEEEQLRKHEKNYSALIIDDNADLRSFLKSKLSASFEIFEAEDGKTAIHQCFANVPDIIICDIALPFTDGLELTRIFKSDIKTAHIPIILLTAKANLEQQVQGMKYRADAYITKPFNANFLEETIHSLLINRESLREHFSSDVSGAFKGNLIGKTDKKFLNEFTTYVEANISNEDLGIDEICKSLGMSKMQLYRKVKSLLNVNINDYILQARLKKARYLLQNEKLSVSEVSYKVGFASPGYFSTVFKSKFNISPKDFKKVSN
ncbi:MAG: substrate-binding domain-containing protein [Ferruginibacter sp.]